MKEKGKPETEQARYRNMLHSLSAKVLVLQTAARAGEVQEQARSVSQTDRQSTTGLGACVHATERHILIALADNLERAARPSLPIP